MKKLISYAACISFFFLSSLPSSGQNLVKNPGFESDKTSWNSFWSNEGSGSAIIVNTPVHSGSKALKITYPGTKDWAFTSSDKIPVSPGSIYDMSCWMMASDLTSEANLSVVLYDSKQLVLNWAYSRIKLTKASSVYSLYSTRFIIPEGVYYIQPRLEGWGSCTVFADDVSLSLSATSGLSGNYTLENSQVKAIIQLPSLVINLTNKSSAKSYQTGWAQFCAVQSVEQINPQTLRMKAELIDNLHTVIFVDFSLEGKALKTSISGDPASPLNSEIQFPGTIPSQPNENLIIPRGTGIMVPVNSSPPFGNYQTYSWKSTMPFVGVTNLKDGYMVAADDQFDAEFQFEKPTGQSLYSFKLRHKPAKNQLSYDRTVYLVLVDNGYVEMCSWYRDHAEKLGYVKTFTQKVNDNPNVGKLIGAVDFWPISMSIDAAFLEQVKLMGMDKAMWNLTGSWGAHNFSVLIDSINSKGFLSNRYDIFTDVWPPTHPEWTWYRNEGYPDDVIVDATGGLKKGWLSYQNSQPFQGYYTCAETHLAYAKKHVPDDLKTNRYNSRFIDVELAASLEECFSPVHPMTRKQDAAARNRLLSYIKNDLKLVTGVEEAHDFAFQNADYGEGTMTIVPAANSGYDWSQPLDPTDKVYADQNISTSLRIPLHGLVYHDVHIPTWYTGDGVSKVPAFWDDKNLWNILYGTMPLYMPPSRAYWNTNLEKFMSGYHLMTAVSRNVGYSKMTDHQFLSTDRKVQKTVFENGWTVVANFDSIPRIWNNYSLSAKGFFASGWKADEAGKLTIDGKTIAWALTGNRLFMNGFGTESSKLGIRTSQSVFIQKFPEFMLVSFIGKQSYVDFKLAELPFGIEEITKVTDYYTGNAVNLTTTTDGWKRLSRPADKSFFKLYYKSGTTGLINNSKNSGIKLFPNPAQTELILKQNRSSGPATLTISSLNGYEIKKQVISQPETRINISSLASGLYFLSFVQDNYREVSKFIKQ